jgi:hypothetical protein
MCNCGCNCNCRSYGFFHFCWDVLLTFLTFGVWLIWIFVREMRRN